MVVGFTCNWIDDCCDFYHVDAVVIVLSPYVKVFGFI